MLIEKINAEELKYCKWKEGVVFYSVGDDPEGFIKHIEVELKAEQILPDGYQFEKYYTFKNEDSENGVALIFSGKPSDVNIDKLKAWKDEISDEFEAEWLTDYVESRFGGFEQKPKPDCKLIGENGNIFNLMGIASRTLKDNGMKKEAKEMTSRVMASDSYSRALTIIGEYVNITGNEEYDENEEESEEADEEDISYDYRLNLNNDKLEVIELFGKRALFTSERVNQRDVPDGLYVCHVRGDDETTGGFAELAPRVLVNHFASIITREPIDFGKDGYIMFTDETEPHFTDEYKSMNEFLNEEENQDMGVTML